MNNNFSIIPKNIYYCWFGRKEKTKDIIKCINTWKKHMPDYKIIEINEDNFDTNLYMYSITAYKDKYYAFVSDCARIHFLNKYGGIYLDTDVELKRSLGNLVLIGDIVISQEKYFFELTGINTSVIISKENMCIWDELLIFYKNIIFNKKDITTINAYITNILCNKTVYFKKNIKQIIYYKNNKIVILPSYLLMENKRNTYAVHHMDKSWGNKLSFFLLTRRIIGQIIKKIFGERIFNFIWKRK